MTDHQPNTSEAGPPAVLGAPLVTALADLLLVADIPQIRQVLGLHPAEHFDPAPGFTLPGAARGFLLTIFSTYRFDRETFRLANPFEVVATPDDEQLESIIRALTFYQPPYSPAHTPLGEFLFLFHAASEIYTKPDAVHSILRLLSGRPRNPVSHAAVLQYLLGRSDSPRWAGLNEDVRRLVLAALRVEKLS